MTMPVLFYQQLTSFRYGGCQAVITAAAQRRKTRKYTGDKSSLPSEERGFYCLTEMERKQRHK
jgi:hypothetical protein